MGCGDFFLRSFPIHINESNICLRGIQPGLDFEPMRAATMGSYRVFN